MIRENIFNVNRRKVDVSESNKRNTPGKGAESK
jgi:hypothetical protein